MQKLWFNNKKIIKARSSIWTQKDEALCAELNQMIRIT